MAKRGLYANIHAKRKRIKGGSKEKMRKAKRKLTARNRLQSDDNKETSSYEMRQLDKKMEESLRHREEIPPGAVAHAER